MIVQVLEGDERPEAHKALDLVLKIWVNIQGGEELGSALRVANVDELVLTGFPEDRVDHTGNIKLNEVVEGVVPKFISIFSKC